MARLEDLVEAVEDKDLRELLRHEVAHLKQATEFGLVFERHLPESVVLPPPTRPSVGDQVVRADATGAQPEMRVASLAGETATVVDEAGVQDEASVDELRVVKGFGEAVYPALTSVGAVPRDEAKPYHSVISGENFHSLQAMQHTWRGAVDCIFIDPPYNTGARDWKYNNDYVDSNDVWRHSKWLSFMEKRLRLAETLLKPNGVLVCTIDEHEVHHLGLLLEKLFPAVRAQLVTIVINPLGQARRQELGRVDEYAYFLFFGDSTPAPALDDLLNASQSGGDATPRWERLLRGGTDSDRASRASMFYPVFIDPETKEIVTVGESLPLGTSRDTVEPPKGQVAVWPVRTNGTEGRWRLQAKTLRTYVEQGVARVGSYDKKNDRWTLSYLGDSMRKRLDEGDLVVTAVDEVTGVKTVEYANATTSVAKTVWNRGSHRAGEYGSRVLSDFLGDRLFPFPKSLYAVADALRVATGDRPDALIVDFFAGSGTTLHATALLNEEDGGRRQCALVTNNEVEDGLAKELREAGHHAGAAEYEKHGIFEAVTRPRCTSALTGEKANGEAVEGQYLSGKPYSEGFQENCEFFRLDYLNPDGVELGKAFEAIHPLLWLIAGARAERPHVVPNGSWALVPECGYAILFEALTVRDFVGELTPGDGIDHVFLVTDSEDAFAEMTEAVGAGRTTHMLYRDYLRSFRIRVGGSE